jgi:FkbM family methyltransferase
MRRLGPSMGTRLVRTRFGFRFQADLADWLGQYVYLTGEYEPLTAALFEHLLGPGDTMLDVGANAGFFSLLCARLVGPDGRVFAFEPIPSVRRQLEANIALNDARQARVKAVAASDRTGTLTMFEGPEGHKGISSLRPLSESSGKLEVQTVAIDDLDNEIGGPIRCVKIDVEGAEMLALLGMQKLLARDRPYLIVEFTDASLRSFGHSVRQMAGWLADREYSVFRIEEPGLIPLNPDDPSLPWQFNVLAVPSLPASLMGRVVAA